jgi:hypothetical protein
VHHSKIHIEKSIKMQQCIKILLFSIYVEVMRAVMVKDGRLSVRMNAEETGLDRNRIEF